MLKSVIDNKTDEVIEVIEATPICGEDFCDSCGDCLYCYGGDDCYYSDGGHYWVEYVNDKKGGKYE